MWRDWGDSSRGLLENTVGGLEVPAPGREVEDSWSQLRLQRGAWRGPRGEQVGVPGSGGSRNGSRIPTWEVERMRDANGSGEGRRLCGRAAAQDAIANGHECFPLWESHCWPGLVQVSPPGGARRGRFNSRQNTNNGPGENHHSLTANRRYLLGWVAGGRPLRLPHQGSGDRICQQQRARSQLTAVSA